MDAYITKPVDIRMLAQVLSGVVPHESKSAETAPGPSEANVIEDSVKSVPPRTEETMSDLNANPVCESSAIDPSVIAALREEGDDLLRELIDLLLADAPKRVTTGREALTRGDLQALEFEMHRLKGATANFGANRTVELCTELRQACSANDKARAAELFSQVAWEYQRVERALEDERRQLAPATAA
jgi:HPt (histidine-containing phosphotransfer) domain-containing protein